MSKLEDVGVSVRVAVRPRSKVEEVLRAVSAEPSVLAAAVTQPERSLEMRVFWTRLRALALKAAHELRPDVVLIGHDMAMTWARDLPHGLPKVLSCQNLLWNWYEARARRTKRPAAALALRAEARRYRRFVHARLPEFHTVTTVSTVERAQLVEMGCPRVALIPVGVDMSALRPAPEQPGPPRVLFTGTMSYPPNHEGAVWLARDVWPLVRARMPVARLDIVGRDPAPSVTALDGRNGVFVAGFVPSMAPFFEAAQVAVAPILTGAGIRVKIIEAMAAGRPVVSTSLGCEGLGVKPGGPVLVADDPQRFAEAILDLLGDSEKRARMGREGRMLAEREFDWRALGDRLEAVLLDAAAAAP